MKTLPPVKAFLSTMDSALRCARQRPIPFSPSDSWREDNIVNLYPEETFQEFGGIGGAFTESAAVSLAATTPARRKAVIKALFDPEKGAGFSVGRVHINSCDFSLGNWSCDETPGDTALADFTIAHYHEAIIPLIRDAEKAAGRRIRLLASPWSPPAWMKSNGKMNEGGTLLPEYREAWAKFYVRFVEEFAAAGIKIDAISVQNEPKAVQTWDSCLWSGEEERDFVRDHLGPVLRRAGLLKDVGIYIWDHNKERVYDRAVAVLSDPKAAKFVRGVAFHWYSGAHFEALELVKKRFPKTKLLLSEFCCSSHEKTDADRWTQAEYYAQELIGDLNAGTDALLDWNLVLDEEGGPNHVSNFCAAPIRVNRATKEVSYEPIYWALRHIGAFIKPGAVRIGVSVGERLGLAATAYRNPDGSLVTVLVNRSDRNLHSRLRLHDTIANFEMPAHSIQTLVV